MKVVIGTDYTPTKEFTQLVLSCYSCDKPLTELDKVAAIGELNMATEAREEHDKLIAMAKAMVILHGSFIIAKDGFHIGSDDYYHEMDEIVDLDGYTWIRVTN